MKSMYGTSQAARQWHVSISTWMEDRGYLAVNSEKTIFMKRAGEDWILHGLYVDNMIHAAGVPRGRSEAGVHSRIEFNTPATSTSRWRRTSPLSSG